MAKPVCKCPKPPLSEPALVAYAETHIANEVRWFIRAMTSYESFFLDDSKLPANTIVAYLDSALLHGRSSIEFFLHSQGWPEDVRACHFRSAPSHHLDGPLGDWKKALDVYLSHLTSKRDASASSTLRTRFVTTGSEGRGRWKLEDLWGLLEASFGDLRANCRDPVAGQFFEELLRVQVPGWRSAT